MLKSLCTTTLLLGTIACASPRLTFDDSGFDYRPNDREAIAYVDLQRFGEELRFAFSNQPGAADLPSVKVTSGVDLERDDRLGRDEVATVDDLDVVAVDHRGAAASIISVDHEGAGLAETVRRYLVALEDLGYSVQPTFSTSTLQVYTFGDDDGHFRAIFHRQNGHVQVRIAR